MKVYLSSLGCKLNEGELEAWTRRFAQEGNEIVLDAREADLCVVNSCTVTQVAARKSRGLVNRLASANSNSRIVLTGCYATMSPDEARALPNVACVVPNSEKDELVALASRFKDNPSYEISQNGCRMPEAASGQLGVEIGIPHVRTRAFVKIEDGCNMSCAYCIIPLARGRAKSRPQEEILAEVAALAHDGYQEVILTGVQISDYQLEQRNSARGRLNGLCSLIQKILNETQLARLRLTSIAPWDLDKELLDLMSDRRICRHLHLSLQSGSRRVLRRMRRPYSPEEFAAAVDLARSRLPDVAVTTDVIVGFPGESDAEFQESMEFVERMEFARVHVFPYSARAGTLAAVLPLQVKQQVREARAKSMQEVATASASKFSTKFVGRSLPVLYETETEPSGFWVGYTDNYIRVVTPIAGENLSNQIVQTRIEGIREGGALGSVMSYPRKSVHPHIDMPELEVGP